MKLALPADRTSTVHERLWAKSRLIFSWALLAFVSACHTRNLSGDAWILPDPTLAVRWRIHLVDPPFIDYRPEETAGAESDGQRIYVGTSSGTLFCLASYDGSILWRHRLAGGILARPLLSSDGTLVFVGTQGGMAYALEVKTGQERWQFSAQAPIEARPAAGDGLIFFSTSQDRTIALDARTGALRWQVDHETPEGFTVRGHAAPVIAGETVFIGHADGTLAAMAAKTGEVRWTRSIAKEGKTLSDVDSTPLLLDGVLYASSFSGGVFALDPADGAVKWQYEIAGAKSLAIGSEQIFITSAEAGIVSLSMSGELLWKQRYALGEMTSPLLLRRIVYFASGQGGLYAVDALTGRLRQYFSPGKGSAATPTTDGKQIYWLTNQGYFYAFDPLGPSV